MGCSTSAHYPPEIIEFKAVEQDEDFITGNKKSTTVVAAGTTTISNNHTTVTVRFSDNNNEDNRMTKESGGDVMRGDVTQRHQAKLARQKTLLEKQKKVSSAAEELANQVLEEKERLSLTSRSRGTSRATSRTGSPTTARKHITFKPQEPELKSEGGDILADASHSSPTANGKVRVNS